MKFSNEIAATTFCEQVSMVTTLFDKWSDCERTVVIYALLKHLRHPNLKFLQYSIENCLTQNIGLYNQMLAYDINANSSLYLQNLFTAYKTLSNSGSSDNTDKDAVYFGSDFVLKTDLKLYNRKKDILNEILEIVPLLKPGNDDAKQIYINLIPIAVEDAVRDTVPHEIVQQIFSYLLIHPAVSNEERRSLNHWVRQLEDHIQSSYAPVSQQNYYVLSNNTDPSPSNSSASVGSLSGSANSKNAWQAIAPPQQSTHKNQQQSQQSQQQQPSVSVLSDKTEWNVTLPSISDNLCDNFSGIKLNELASSQNSLGLTYSGTTACAVGSVTNSNNTSEDHHTSFSRNGTEILDFDTNTCDNCNCTQLGGYPSLLNTCDHFNENRWSLDSKVGCKTRRSNSLTTAISSFTSANAEAIATVSDNCSNSSENLAQYAQKPRSFSLSIENPRTSMISSGSDTRLDDIKPNYLKFSTHNSGMSNIGQWLKSLRLHKYIDLFKNITYEAMLEITEDYLQSLGVTKGASHKLALCIEKLNDRDNILTRIEEEFISGEIKLHLAMEELASIVLTPMKPADATVENVAFKFLKIIDLISTMFIQKESFSQQDEENVSVLLWILERTMHSEAFGAHTNQLKELKFKLSKIKISLAPKVHHPKSGSSSNLSKPRWNCKNRKTDQKNGSSDRINRKNSTDMLSFSLNCPQQHVATPRNSLTKGVSNTAGSSGTQYKSSSYPNFASGVSVPGQSFHQVKPHVSQQSIFVNQPNFSSTSTHQQVNLQQHRRSLNNLIVVSPGQPTLPISTANVCVSSSPIASKTNLSIGSEVKNRKSNIATHSSSIRGQQSTEIKSQKTSTTTSNSSISSTSSNGGANKPLEKTMAAVVLVSNKKSSDLEDFNRFENNNNNVNLIRDNKVCNIGLCTSTQSCASALSNNICSAITSSLLLGKEKHLKNNNISDIKSLEQLEFLCLQMTEQAIN